MGGIVEVNALGRFSEQMLKKTGSEMRRSRSFVERSALTRSAYIKRESKVYLSFGTEIAIRKPYEIEKQTTPKSLTRSLER